MAIWLLAIQQTLAFVAGPAPLVNQFAPASRSALLADVQMVAAPPKSSSQAAAAGPEEVVAIIGC